jgi:hypothetical protein
VVLRIRSVHFLQAGIAPQSSLHVLEEQFDSLLRR